MRATVWRFARADSDARIVLGEKTSGDTAYLVYEAPLRPKRGSAE